VTVEYPYTRTLQEAAEAAGYEDYRLTVGGIMVSREDGTEEFHATAAVHKMTEAKRRVTDA